MVNKEKKMDITKGINPRDRKNIARKIRSLKRHNYSELSIDDKITLWELEEKLEGTKKSYNYYESKGEKRRKAKQRRDRRRK